MTISTLKPGLLVSLKTSIRGNISYDTIDLENKKERARWETTRTIADVDEYERAKMALQTARGTVARVCAHTAFGYLCPERDRDVLEDAIRVARQIVEDFNSQAAMTRINLYCIAGRIAADDEQAAKAINSEVRDMIDRMAEGVKNMDVKVIRETANKARLVGQMLSPNAQGNLQRAIDTARAVAKSVVKAGESAALEVDRVALRNIVEQRTAFLDMDEADLTVTRPEAEARAVDLEV